MGKTENGAIWISKEKITAYDFYQGVYQTPDACVEMMFALFTDVPMVEVRELISKDIIGAKKRLSYEITKFIRGEEDAISAEKATEALFSKSGSMSEVPTIKIENFDKKNGMNITDMAFASGIVATKSEARRTIEQGGLSLNDKKVTDFAQIVTVDDFNEGFAIIKKGKKSFIKVVLQ